MPARVPQSKKKSVLPRIVAAPNAYRILTTLHQLPAAVVEEVRQSLLFCWQLSNGDDRRGEPGAVYSGWGEFRVWPLWNAHPDEPDVFILSVGDGIYWPHIPEEVDYPHALKLKDCKPLPFVG